VTDTDDRTVGDTPVKKRRLRQIPFNQDALDLIGETLAVDVRPASFRLPNAAVYQLLVPGAANRPEVMLTLWPSIRRVDAITSSATVVFTNVAAVELVEDVEVLFRRTTREYLIVARGGKVIVRS
jgi:hypothetical protein